MNGEVTISEVLMCARCGEDHAHVTFKRLTRPAATFAYWAMCPTLDEPILMRVKPESESEPKE